MVILVKIKVGVSNRHVHLNQEALDLLFGKGYKLTKRNDLTQENDFACNETVDIQTDKDKIEKVRIIGPVRDYIQVEISKTDSYKLGVNPPLRMSGDLNGAESVIIVGPKNKIEVKNCLINACRHIHIDPETSKKLKISDKNKYKVYVDGQKGGVMSNVLVKIKKGYKLELHIDTDDANAFLIKTGDELIIEKEN